MNPRRIGTGETTQIAVRLEDETLKEIDEARERLSVHGMTPTRVDVVRTALKRGLNVIDAELESGSTAVPTRNVRAMRFEGAIRYVHDRCERRGSDGEADADVYRAAEAADQWRHVAYALARAAMRLEKDARAIKWTPEEQATAGLQPNSYALHEAAETLSSAYDIGAAFAAVASLLHATKALILKASDRVPSAYRGEVTKSPAQLTKEGK